MSISPDQLSDRERAAISFIEAYTTTQRRPPSTTEISVDIGLSLGGTHGLIQRLLAWGYLAPRWKSATQRNLRVMREV